MATDMKMNLRLLWASMLRLPLWGAFLCYMVSGALLAHGGTHRDPFTFVLGALVMGVAVTIRFHQLKLNI